MRHLLIAALLLSPALALGDPAPVSSLRPADLVGCFAVARDGSKMACASHERGLRFVEVKGTSNRRVYKNWPAPDGQPTTSMSAERVRTIAKWLDGKGFARTELAERGPRGLRLPGMMCDLAVDEKGSSVLTLPEGGGEGRAWVLIDGHGGGSTLTALAADPVHDRALLALDHTTAAKDAVVREVKLLPLSDLAGRKECRPSTE